MIDYIIAQLTELANDTAKAIEAGDDDERLGRAFDSFVQTLRDLGVTDEEIVSTVICPTR